MVQVRDDSGYNEMGDNGAIGSKIESMCILTVKTTGHINRLCGDIYIASAKKKRKVDSRMIPKLRSIRKENGVVY